MSTITEEITEKCENCKHFCKINMYQRQVGTIGANGYVSGWEVVKNHWKEDSIYGCTLFLQSDGVVTEVETNDRCEMFEGG